MIPNSHHFLDISQIYHRDTDIQFSVEKVLASDEYLKGSPFRNQKIYRCVTKRKESKSGRKKDKQIKFKGQYLEEGSKKKVRKMRVESKEYFDEKETQDQSDNYKKGNSQATVQPTNKEAINKGEVTPRNSQQQMVSNKSQPYQNPKSRTKSTSTLTPVRKQSLLKTVQCHGTPIKSHLTLSPSQVTISKVRSQTIRFSNEEIKAKNENIVINDYFYENCNKISEKDSKKNVQKVTRKRSTSGRKIEYQSKKLKRPTNIHQNIVPKSPRYNKK